MRRNAFESAMDKRSAVKEAESKGLIADSIEVRKGIMERINSGEITLEQGQAELAKIKKAAKKQGMITREQAYKAG